MSAQSTPRSTRSVSVGASPTHMLTPGQKIKAMLAQFDSDSESENVTTTSKTHRIAAPNFTTGVSKNIAPAVDEEDDEDEDTTILVPRGRMAARMQGLQNTEVSWPSEPIEAAYERVTKTLHLPSADPTSNKAQSSDEYQSSEDEMPNTAPTRRRLLNTKERQLNNSTTESHEPWNQHSARSESPLFVEEDSDTVPRIENNTSTEEPKDARFLALIERKRKERQERERIEAEKKASRVEKMKQFGTEFVASDESDEDPENAKQLTQPSRPARKASKKALEEMARETQRLSRNRQLAYQPRVKRKITIDSFVALMNSNKIEQPSEPTDEVSSSSAPSSETDGNKQKETPPTSPAETSFDEQKHVHVRPLDSPQLATSKAHKVPNESRVRVRLSREEVAKRQDDEPDDDLEIITSPSKCRKAAIFENLRSKNLSENQTMLKLKLLARLTSATSRTKSMSPAELSAMLQLKARQQALRERQERIEELRAQGIVIETAEEREAIEADIEDLMERARQEADAIARREKAARGNNPGVSDDEDEDDYDYALSGSEDEDEGGMEEDVESAEEGDSEEELEEELEAEIDHPVQGLVDNETDVAEESSHEDEEIVTHGIRGRRPRRVVTDDEEDDEASEMNPTAVQEPKTPARSIAASVGSAQRPQFPDMPGSSTFTMSLTQAFAGTIAEDQSDGEEDSFKVLQSLPDPGLPNFQQMAVDSQVEVEVEVKDSQDQRRGSIDLFAGYTQSSSRVPESPGPNWSQYSQMPEPTQDIGFVYSPIDVSKRFVEPPVSTIDTVILPANESPVMRKKGRLLQRGRPAHLSDDEGGDFEIKASAFDVMKKASKQKSKAAITFDKSNSKAKDHIDEAAEESEDEYAGLGGASDDDNGEEDELDREMINDDSGEVVDEKELAALNANHQRTMDEKQVSKLLKDITTGALRRRRGADDDLDLDDSDDERLARRRAKQREFAKMRKALLADEKVNEIASNPKKQAFFKALEDRDDDDEMEFEFDNGTDSKEESFQDNQNEEQPAGTNAGGESEKASHKRKRPLEPTPEDVSNRPPPHLRRTAANVSRKPSTLAEIRETLSFLTATPEYDSFHEDASIEEEIVYSTDKANSGDETENDAEPSRKSSTDGFAIPPNPRRTRGPIVDRLALQRASSSNSARAGAKPAFVTSNTSSWDTANVGFRPPPLLRRATSSWSTSDSSSSFSTTGTKKSASGPKPGLSNSNKGSVNYYTAARERERERDLRLKERGGGSKITATKIAQLQKQSLENGLLAWSKKGSGFEV
uniref:Mediator of replication checkpoint protein 1 n=1 Tax=Talaromyces marneffei PM1 TaxID=1077442 RepID=A0A093Y287_TALMA